MEKVLFYRILALSIAKSPKMSEIEVIKRFIPEMVKKRTVRPPGPLTPYRSGQPPSPGTP
jgi:hypothetical protein